MSHPLELKQIMPAWLANLLGHREQADLRTYLRSFGGLFALGARWWCFSPVSVRGEATKMTNFPDAFYPPGTDDAHARRVLSLIEGHKDWHSAERSALYLFAVSLDLIAAEDATSIREGHLDPLEEGALPSGLVVAGVPVDVGELSSFTAFLPAEDLDLAGIDLPLGSGGMPAKMLVFRWARPGQSPSYFALHRCPDTIHGQSAAPISEWIDWDVEQERQRTQVAKALPPTKAN